MLEVSSCINAFNVHTVSASIVSAKVQRCIQFDRALISSYVLSGLTYLDVCSCRECHILATSYNFQVPITFGSGAYYNYLWLEINFKLKAKPYFVIYCT